MQPRVELQTTSSAGCTVITKIAGDGEILGLSAVVLGQPYQLSAETLEPVQTTFIRGDEFMKLLATNSDLSMRTALELSKHLRRNSERFCTTGAPTKARPRTKSVSKSF